MTTPCRACGETDPDPHGRGTGQCMTCGAWDEGVEEGNKRWRDLNVEWWRRHLADWLALPPARTADDEAHRESAEVFAIRRMLWLTRRFSIDRGAGVIS